MNKRKEWKREAYGMEEATPVIQDECWIELSLDPMIQDKTQGSRWLSSFKEV